LNKLLEVKNIKVYFFLNPEDIISEKDLSIDELTTYITDKRFKNKFPAKAIDGVSFDIYEGEIFGIVGESGSGKSVTAHSIMRLIPEPQGKIVEGEIIFKGINLLELDYKELQNYRGKQIGMIFQEPFVSLNPVLKISDQITEAILIDKDVTKSQAKEKALNFLKDSGIKDPENVMNSYPHQLSGGIKQRIMIAIALSRNPSLLIADEPTTSLDVTIQNQILELLIKIKNERKDFSILFISHNLGVVYQICDRLMIMYAGKVQEIGTIDDIFRKPLHPYTEGLLACYPNPDKSKYTKLNEIPGIIPSVLNYPRGCKFHPRCNKVMDICKIKEPELARYSASHIVRCHLYNK
jgi:peptide/nickel transport system ATP-binding protein